MGRGKVTRALAVASLAGLSCFSVLLGDCSEND